MPSYEKADFIMASSRRDVGSLDGINAQSLVVDAGMSINYFDNDLVRRALRPDL